MIACRCRHAGVLHYSPRSCATCTLKPFMTACPVCLQDVAAAAGDARLDSQLWAGLLRAHALLPALPPDAAEQLQDQAAHEASTAGASPPGVVSLQVRSSICQQGFSPRHVTSSLSATAFRHGLARPFLFQRPCHYLFTMQRLPLLTDTAWQHVFESHFYMTPRSHSAWGRPAQRRAPL